jgi:membrane AbrB-like protein
VTVAGWAVIDLPNSVINFAQVVIGTSLGVRFKGMSKSAIARGIWLSLMSVTFMLALGACATVILGHVTDMQTLVLLISFAPGGVTEMSLIALSLAANPALVTLHHLVRILLTVVTMGFLGPKVDTAA